MSEPEGQSSRRYRRFFSSSPLSQLQQQITLSREETRHLRTIMRYEVGDRCLVTDGQGKEAAAEILEFSENGQAILQVYSMQTSQENPKRMKLMMYVALPQKGKMDKIMEKAQELSVDAICPIETKRTIVKMSRTAKDKVLARWQKIIREAAKQSGRSRLLEIRGPFVLEEAVSAIPEGERVAVFHPSEQARLCCEWMETYRRDPSPSPMHVFIGPEGGFEEEEVRMMVNQRGAEVVSLGAPVLKVDTAFVAVASLIRIMLS